MRTSILFVIRIVNNRYWVALSMEVGLTMLNITVRFHHSQIETRACVLDPLSSLIYAMWPSHQVHIFKSWTFGWLDHGLLLSKILISCHLLIELGLQNYVSSLNIQITLNFSIVNIRVIQISWRAGSCWCASTSSGEVTLPEDNVRGATIICFTN